MYIPQNMWHLFIVWTDLYSHTDSKATRTELRVICSSDTMNSLKSIITGMETVQFQDTRIRTLKR